MSRLEKLVHSHGQYLLDRASGTMVYHVDTPHALIQAAGFLKFSAAQEQACHVLYRGQSRLHGVMKPTLYRGAQSQNAKSKRDVALKDYISETGPRCLRDVPDFAQEPLLQHYGIRTRWLDVVDNIWVALWFACYEATVVGRLGEYLHFDRRAVETETDYAYVVIMRADAAAVDHMHPGLISGERTTLIDLRVACPSVFLRPHAQHGFLIRRAKGLDHNGTDYSDLIAGTLRVRLKDAITWLGDGTLLSTRMLFPPATYDFGYRRLLEAAPPGNIHVGSIHLVGA